VAVHGPPMYSEEVGRITVAEARKGHDLIGVADSVFLNIPALTLAQKDEFELNRAIEQIVRKEKPRIVLMPFYDRHSDHRSVFETAMVATRPAANGGSIPLIAAYEVLSSTYNNAPHVEPNFAPNWVVDIGDFIDIKLEALKCCESQIGPVPHPRSCAAIKALAVFRGSQAGMSHGEGFQIIRMSAPPESLG